MNRLIIPAALLALCTLPLAAQHPSDRDAAEWIIRTGGSVRLMNGAKPIRELFELPPGDFRIVSVDLVGTDFKPPELHRLSGLTELRELLLPGTIFNPGAGSKLDANEEFKALAGLTKLE
ncbi:MAG: hypothetical protein ACRD7E_02640, partial [Bryobacteraceae bacterium]